MHECISLHIGQAGVNIGSSCWELYCLEHGIQSNGYMTPGIIKCADNSFRNFFGETVAGKYVPHALFIDLEPTAINEIRTGPYQELFDPENLINGMEDTERNYIIGRCSETADMVRNRVRKLSEQCSDMQGFLIFHSMGGGTGSGLTSLLIEHLSYEYEKKKIIEFAIYPSTKLQTSVFETYNTILNTHDTLDISDIVFLFNNGCLFDICSLYLNLEFPTYANINRLIAQVVSAITSSLRNNDCLNVNLAELHENLVPYPRIHFPLVTYAPVNTKGSACQRELSVKDITRACFDTTHLMQKCVPQQGKYMAGCMLYRGDVSPKDINAAIESVISTRTIKFVDNCNAKVKIGIKYQPPTVIPGGVLGEVERAVCMLSNTTAVVQVWERLNRKFDSLYATRNHLHHYIDEGWTENDFEEAQLDLAALEMDYMEVEGNWDGSESDGDDEY